MVAYDDAYEKSLEYFEGDELAAQVFLGKYALTTQDGELSEETPDDMHRRLAKEFSRIEKKYENPLPEDKIYEYLKDFRYIIPQGSPLAGIGNPYQVMSLSNCFVIQQPYDSYGGILKTDQEEAQLMKRRGGVGFDLSTIRPKGLQTSNAAKTTDGIGVFMERFSNTCREVGQGGRRGALMLTISVHHPEIRTFVNIKRDLKRVTGANISVRLSDEFMNAVKNKKKVQLRWPVEDKENPTVKTQIDAAELWHEIIESAWESAEPGLLFWDNCTKYTPSDAYTTKGFQSTSTNPCVVGDTLIAVADGRNAVPIAKLAQEGVDVPVYATDPETGQVSIKWGRNPRKTGTKKEIWKLTLDDGSNLIATPDHRILTKEGTYIELRHLKPGTSLMPFNSFNSNGYRQIAMTGQVMRGGRYRTGHTNEKLLAVGRKLFETHGKLTYELWTEHAKKNGYSQHLANEFHFGSFRNFANQVTTNHKVTSVEFVGYDDVYNITVDDYHNYNCITSSEDDQYVVTSGICVKNCGEIVLSNYDSCRLLLVNTVSFVKNPFTSKAEFDYKKFDEVVQVAQRLMDDVIDLELECIDKIQEKIALDPEPDEVKQIEVNLWNKIKKAAIEGRRTGLGVTAIGDTVAALNVQYGSKKSIELIENIYKNLALSSYRSSVNMAKERGAFPAYDHDLEKDHPFITRVLELDPQLKDDWKKYGRRNIANTTTAPAGSVSVLTQTTSGIEPAFLLSYTRRRKINPNDKQARVDFVDDLGDKWQEYVVYHHWFKKWMEITGKTDPKESPYHEATSNDINWVNKVKAQAAAQRWICHSISNTTNVPEETTVDTIKDIYMTGWKSGCKGVTVYRDKCRSGVLVTENSKRNNKFQEHHAPKRPEKLPCDIYHMQVKGEKWNFFVGLYNDKPYEIFAGRSKHIHLPRSRKTGYIKKNGTYNLYTGEGDNELVIEDLATVFENPTESAFTRTVSLAMRHGTPTQYLVEQIEKGADKDNEMFSLAKGLMRVLKNYIKDGTKPSAKKCPECGGKELAYQEGCLTCQGCGYSKCG